MTFQMKEEVDAFDIKNAYLEVGNRPDDRFQGLSLLQMYLLLRTPFDVPELVRFPEQLPEHPDTPASRMFSLLADAIGDKGLKGTAKGNLPRELCRKAALVHLGEQGYAERTEIGPINGEDEFFPIGMINKTAQKAGIIRKAKGRFTLTVRAAKMIRQDRLLTIYPLLFRTYAQTINWAYFDGGPESFFLQRTFPVALYFLTKFGADWRALADYADLFLAAFPSILTDFTYNSPYCEPERHFRTCYTIRVLEHFAEFWGLAEIEGDAGDYQREDMRRIRKMPLLNDLVRFSIP